MTNVVDSPVVDLCDDVVPMWAGDEAGGVACRTYQHTLALLLALEARLDRRPRRAGSAGPGGRGVVPTCSTTRDDWLPRSVRRAPRARRHPRRRARPAAGLGAPVGADAPRGPAPAGVRLRDGRLEPRRRLPHQDHRLPDAAARRLAVGGRAARLGPRARLDPGRGRRRRPRRRADRALPARRRSTTYACSPRPSSPSSSPRAPGAWRRLSPRRPSARARKAATLAREEQRSEQYAARLVGRGVDVDVGARAWPRRRRAGSGRGRRPGWPGPSRDSPISRSATLAALLATWMWRRAGLWSAIRGVIGWRSRRRVEDVDHALRVVARRGLERRPQVLLEAAQHDGVAVGHLRLQPGPVGEVRDDGVAVGQLRVEQRCRRLGVPDEIHVSSLRSACPRD